MFSGLAPFLGPEALGCGFLGQSANLENLENPKTLKPSALNAQPQALSSSSKTKTLSPKQQASDLRLRGFRVWNLQVSELKVEAKLESGCTC